MDKSTGRSQVKRNGREETLARIESAATITGIVLLFSLLAAVLLLRTSPSDSGQRGAGHGALLATSWLTILWVMGAVGVAALRRRATRVGFRVILVANAVVVCLLAAEFWFR